MANTKKLYPITDLSAAYGDLTFMKFEEVETVSSGFGRNAKNVNVGRRYELLTSTESEVKVYTDMAVREFSFPFGAKVRLLNPRLEVVSVPIDRSGAYLEERIWCDGIEQVK